MKVFLSHSSANKTYVSGIFDYLTAARAHYDSVTFESFQRSFDAIYGALNDSDIFCFFASPESLNSPWVKEEIKLACDPASVGKRLERVVVLLGVQHGELPPELRQCTSISYTDPNLVARKLESLLVEMQPIPTLKRLFVGREDDLKVLSSGMAPVNSRATEFIFLAGLPGVGRKSAILRAIQDNFPFIKQSLRVIAVSKGTGPSDLYFNIRSRMMVGTVAEHAAEIGRFHLMNVEEQSDALAQLIDRAVSERDPLILDDSAWLMTDSGEVSPWFVEVLQRLKERPFPQVVMISSRALSVAGRAALSRRFFVCALQSLSKPSSSRLLWLQLQNAGIEIQPAALNSLVDAVDGHPDQIVRAASLIVSGKSLGAELRIREVTEALARSAESLVKVANLTPIQYLVIKLFNEFEYMSAEDVSAAFTTAMDFERAFYPLLDFCFVEHMNGFFRLAPSIARALVRMADGEADPDQFIDMRSRIAARLSSLTGEDLIEFDVLEKSVAAWVRSSKLEPPLAMAKMLLPASLLRCARRAYDARDWGATADFSERALDGAWKLTDEAELEAYRLRGLSLARRDDPAFPVLLSNLSKNTRFQGGNAKVAKRTHHFLRAFKARLDCDYSLARSELEIILKEERRPNFSILREYSDVLMKIGDLDRALQFSSRALEMAGSNPFVLAMHIDILDRKMAREGNISALSGERRRLFERLKRVDETDRTSFSLLREARQLTRDKDYTSALGLLDMAGIDRSSDPIVIDLERARIYLQQGNFGQALTTAERVRKAAVAALAGRAAEYFPEIDEIRIRALIEQNRIDEADAQLRDAKRLDAVTRDELSRLVGFGKAKR